MADLEHKEAMQLMEDDWESDSDNREDALDDLKFLAYDQWDQAERNLREQEGRPCLTIDRLNGFVNQVAGDIRQAQPGIEVFPVDSKDDIPIAEIYEGLIRQIEYQSGAQSAYAHGAESAVRCGIGHWRIETAYTNDSVFEQEIKIRRVLDPLSVVWGSDGTEIDRSDATRCWATELIHKNEWKKRFKGLKREGQDVPVYNNEGEAGSLYWRRDDFIRIAEYWYLKPEKRTLVLISDGATLDITDWEESERNSLAGMVLKAREVDGFSVKRRLMDGVDWLEDTRDWAGRFIPFIPVIGAEIAFDGKIMRHGLIRGAKDGQKLYNYWRSAGAELIGKSPKAPWLVTPDMIKGYEGYWGAANRSNLPYLPYQPDQKAPTLRPERQQPPTVPASMWQEAAQAADDMKASTGIYDASLGAQGNEQSGRAILARQREGDVGSFLYTDNFAQAMRRTGQILVDLIPRIYDTDRQVRILAPDGEEAFVRINREVSTVYGERLLINDLSHGRFDVRVKVGGSYTTARVEAREMMAEAMQNNPNLWAVIGDLYFKNTDYPGAEEIAERLRRAIPPELLGEEAPQQPPDPMAEALQRLEIAEREGKLNEQDAKTKKTLVEIQKLMSEIGKTEAETVETYADTDKTRAETFGSLASTQRTQLETSRTALTPIPVPQSTPAQQSPSR